MSSHQQPKADTHSFHCVLTEHPPGAPVLGNGNYDFLSKCSPWQLLALSESLLLSCRGSCKQNLYLHGTEEVPRMCLLSHTTSHWVTTLATLQIHGGNAYVSFLVCIRKFKKNDIYLPEEKLNELVMDLLSTKHHFATFYRQNG